MFQHDRIGTSRASRPLLVAGISVVSLFVGLLALQQGRFETGERRVVPPDSAISIANHEPIEPLPQRVELNAAKVDLGRKLFNDQRLSRDSTMSCASCHDLARGGGDGMAHSRGVGGTQGNVNAPSVFNTGFAFRQFWDGRAASLEEQVSGPLQNPIEMASTWPKVLGKLKEDREYVRIFGELYEDGVQSRNVQDAIATFERSLTTPDSPFDRYLRGDANALGAVERAGYVVFKERGCTACHQGVNIGGNMYQSLGVFGDFFTDRHKDASEDQGRFNVTGREEDRHVFKVPSLRNVALTAPYFHDGSVATLDEAVRIMGKYQVGRELSRHEVELIVAFLRTLTGRYQGKPL